MHAGSGETAWARAVRRLGVDIRPGEGELAALLSLGFFLIVTFQYVGKTVRQSTFVDSLGATRLPWAYLLVALCAWPLLKLHGRASARMSRHRLMAATCLAALAGTVLFWWLLGRGWPWVPVAFYVWISLTFATTISQFWSLGNHLFDARQAKRLFGMIGAGGLLGGIAGGQVARLAGEILGARSALLAGAGLLALALAVVARVRFLDRRAGQEEPGGSGQAAPREGRGGLDELLHSRHLRLVGALVVLAALTGLIVDLQFNWAVERNTSDLGERTAAFGNFFSLIGVAALAFQLLFTGRVLRTLGVGFALRVTPATLGAGSVLLLAAGGFMPGLLIAACLAMKVGENGLRYSLDQSARELLFLPVPASQRHRAKAFVDVFVHRGAKGAGALLLMPVAFGLISPVHMGWATLALCAGWMVVAGQAYRTYVASFRSGLRHRSVDSAVPVDLSDVRTVELLVQSLGSPDAKQVLHSLEILASNGRASLVPPLLLYHDDPEIRRRTLEILGGMGRQDAAPLVERRLGDENPDVRAEAIRVLTAFQSGDACQLMLPRLRESDPRVKAAAVTCLLNHGEGAMADQARRTLGDMLTDARSSHRAEAVRALGAVRGSEFETRLLQALEDPDPAVARVAIASVRRLVSKNGFSPVFLPRLVSLLANHRLKQDVRQALAVFGQEAIPALVHFMNERGESVRVRRALPRVLASYPGPTSLDALLDTLEGTEDGEQRTQIIEALLARREEIHQRSLQARIEGFVVAESQRYLQVLADLASIGGLEGVRVEGVRVLRGRDDVGLLSQMLAERLEGQMKNLFGLLALLHPAREIWAAWRSLKTGRSTLRAHAVEFLDNTLGGEVRRRMLTVIDESPVSRKLHQAASDYGVRSSSRREVLKRYVLGHRDGCADTLPLAVAGLYSIYTRREETLYPSVADLAASAPEPLIRETATWVKGKIEIE